MIDTGASVSFSSQRVLDSLRTHRNLQHQDIQSYKRKLVVSLGDGSTATAEEILISNSNLPLMNFKHNALYYLRYRTESTWFWEMTSYQRLTYLSVQQEQKASGTAKHRRNISWYTDVQPSGWYMQHLTEIATIPTDELISYVTTSWATKIHVWNPNRTSKSCHQWN